MVSKKMKGITYAIRDIVLPAKKLIRAGHEILSLNIGDPDQYDFDTPDFIKEALCEATRMGHNHYSDSEGIPVLLDAIVESNPHLPLERNRTMVTSGVSEAVNFLSAAMLDPGDELLVPSPNYPLYMSLPQLYGGSAVEYMTLEERGWQPDLEDMESKIHERTKGIVVINPNNPTGALYPKKTLKEIANLAGQHNIPIISDEIYDKLAFRKDVSICTLADDIQFVYLNGISKNYLAPGWRVGYASFMNCKWLYDACMKMARIRLCTNTPCQYAFAAALNGPTDHIEETKRKLLARRDLAYRRLNEIDGISCEKPEAAFYAFPKLEGDVDDKKWALDLLHQEKVLVVHGSGFGVAGKSHFRIVFLPREADLNEAFDRIGRFMKGR